MGIAWVLRLFITDNGARAEHWGAISSALRAALITVPGLDIATARTVVVKSRGHFRGGFDEFFKDEQIVEVDCPGLTSPMLSRFDWTRLPRPVVPLDESVSWTPPAG